MFKDIWEESSYKDALAAIAEKQIMRNILKVNLQGRFAHLEDDMIACIDKADADQLLDLAFHAGTDTLPQLRERLGLPPAP